MLGDFGFVSVCSRIQGFASCFSCRVARGAWDGYQQDEIRIKSKSKLGQGRKEGNEAKDTEWHTENQDIQICGKKGNYEEPKTFR